MSGEKVGGGDGRRAPSSPGGRGRGEPLWRHARSSEREECLHRGGRPVVVWPTVTRLVALTKRSLRAVETDLKLLREASLIMRAKRVIGERRLLGSAWA